jgi:hypothetical protein
MLRRRWPSAANIAATFGCAFLVAGCGSGGSKPGTTIASNGGPVSVAVTSPTSGSVIGSENVTVRGTVTPVTARVELNGHAAPSGGGSFAGIASLHPGQNTVNIIASAPGQSPGTTTLVLIRQTSGSGGATQARQGSTTSRAAQQTSTAPQQKPSPTVTATGGWPAGTPAWTVVLASVGTRGEADAQLERAHQASLPETGVLLSTQHSSLRPGYWVAFSGVLSHEDAEKRQQQAHASGFTDAYARFVSAE